MDIHNDGVFRIPQTFILQQTSVKMKCFPRNFIANKSLKCCSFQQRLEQCPFWTCLSGTGCLLGLWWSWLSNLTCSKWALVIFLPLESISLCVCLFVDSFTCWGRPQAATHTFTHKGSNTNTMFSNHFDGAHRLIKKAHFHFSSLLFW